MSDLCDHIDAALRIASALPGEAIMLAAIEKSGRIPEPDNYDGCSLVVGEPVASVAAKLAQAAAAGWDLYYQPTPVRPEARWRKRARAADAAVERVLLWDIDPLDDDPQGLSPDLDAAAERLQALVASVSSARLPKVDTGRGRQMLLRGELAGRGLRVALMERARRVCTGLAVKLDSTFDASRLCRLPGSINSRTGRRARIIEEGAGAISRDEALSLAGITEEQAEEDQKESPRGLRKRVQRPTKPIQSGRESVRLMSLVSSGRRNEAARALSGMLLRWGEWTETITTITGPMLYSARAGEHGQREAERIADHAARRLDANERVSGAPTLRRIFDEGVAPGTYDALLAALEAEGIARPTAEPRLAEDDEVMAALQGVALPPSLIRSIPTRCGTKRKVIARDRARPGEPTTMEVPLSCHQIYCPRCASIDAQAIRCISMIRWRTVDVTAMVVTEAEERRLLRRLAERDGSYARQPMVDGRSVVVVTTTTKSILQDIETVERVHGHEAVLDLLDRAIRSRAMALREAIVSRDWQRVVALVGYDLPDRSEPGDHRRRSSRGLLSLPSEAHVASRLRREGLARLRELAAAALGCPPERVVFEDVDEEDDLVLFGDALWVQQPRAPP